MKKLLSIWLEPEDIKKLKARALEAYPDQKGAISRFLEDIARYHAVIFRKDATVKITEI